jgi:hypothetical protein
MHTSYAIKWQEPGGHVYNGRLELAPQSLRLSGHEGPEAVEREIGYADLDGLHIGRLGHERIDNHPTLVIERPGGAYLVTALGMQAGILQELVHALSDLKLAAPRHITVVLPLKEGAVARVRELALQGPPFDCEQTALNRHQLLVTDQEALFTFETLAEQGLDALLGQVDVWAAASAWRDLVSGPPRLAELIYSWQRPDPMRLPSSAIADVEGQSYERRSRTTSEI